MGAVLAVAGVAALLVLAIGLRPWLRRRRRRRWAGQSWPAAWTPILEHWPLYHRMPLALRRELRRRILVFLQEKTFYGAHGLEVDDAMRVLIAAQACLLELNRTPTYYEGLEAVIVYPAAFRVRHPAVDDAGVHSEQNEVLSGESWEDGRVVLSWDDTAEGLADDTDGQNVVIHEFAHQLDQATGSANGAPHLADAAAYRDWSRVLEAEYERLQAAVAAGRPSVLDAYGVHSPAEFFAVASEAFFEQGAAVQREYPDLYAQLQRYYQMDPATWPATAVTPGM